MPRSRKIILILTEGKTEAAFYDRLVRWLINKHNKNNLYSYKLINVQGYGNFLKKAIVKSEDYLEKISGKFSITYVFIFLALDEDVFILNKKPPYDINKVAKELKYSLSKYSPEIEILFAHKQIEDIFLEDKDGICEYLKIKCSKDLKGNSGAEKMSKLFRKANKKYFKGKTDDFVDYLDFAKILSARSKMFEPLLKLFEDKA